MSADLPLSEQPTAPTHELKVWPQYFPALRDGVKSFEFRKDDREPRFAVGDVLRLREWDPQRFGVNGRDYTGREVLRRVTYVARDGVIPEGYCVMAIEPIESRRAAPPQETTTPAFRMGRDGERSDADKHGDSHVDEVAGAGSFHAEMLTDSCMVLDLDGRRFTVWAQDAKGEDATLYFRYDWTDPDATVSERRRSGEASDTARLDWLEAQIPTDVGINIYQREPHGVGLFCMAVEKSADNLRSAIDAARGADATATPPTPDQRRSAMPDNCLVWVRSTKPTPWGLRARRMYVVHTTPIQLNSSKIAALRMSEVEAEEQITRLAGPDREMGIVREPPATPPSPKHQENG